MATARWTCARSEPDGCCRTNQRHAARVASRAVQRTRLALTVSSPLLVPHVHVRLPSDQAIAKLRDAVSGDASAFRILAALLQRERVVADHHGFGSVCGVDGEDVDVELPDGRAAANDH